MLITRPKVAELTFQLFGRPLHPELFVIHKSRHIERGGFTAKVDIIAAGHVVTFHHQGVTLAEVSTSANNPLPKRRRLMCHRLRDTCEERVEQRGGVVYQTEFGLETVDPELFWVVQQELSREEECTGLLHHFNASGRVAVGAVSYVNVVARNHLLLVQAFHTFPDDCAIVRSESKFLLPK